MGGTPRRRTERAVQLRNGRPVESFSRDRICGRPGCTTKLSQYNPNPSCAAHGGWADDPHRRSRDLL
jgi:hypothetical protein